MNKDKLNNSGCLDLTAYDAIKHVTKEEKEIDRRVDSVIQAVKLIMGAAGLELTNRIHIRDIKTGKEFR